MPENIKLSICIATLGEPQAMQSLRTAFACLASSPDWELILVVNGCTQPPMDQSFWRSLPFVVKVLHEPRPGKSRALNLAIDTALGELLVFTDDDVTPDKMWLYGLLTAAIAHPEIVVFGGRIFASGIVPAWVRASSNLQTALLSEHDFGDVDVMYPIGAYPIGPNMAVRRSAIVSHKARWIETIGPGTSLPVGDETNFMAQISPPDMLNRCYVANAVVHHHVDGRYFMLPRAVQRAFQIGLAAGKLAANIPMGPIGKRSAAHNLPRQIKARVAGLRSLKELACVVARTLGVFVGSKILWRY